MLPSRSYKLLCYTTYSERLLYEGLIVFGMDKTIRKVKLHLRRQKREQVRRIKRVRKHPVMVPIATFLGLTLITLSGLFVYGHISKAKFRPLNNYIVIVSHDHHSQTVPTNERTVGALVKKLGIRLSPGDRLEPAADTKIEQDNFRVNIYRAVPVEIVVNGQRTFALSAGTTPRTIAAQVGVTIYPEDAVEVAPTSNFLDHNSLAEQVVVDAAKPINLNLYGTPTVTRTRAATVGALLKAKHITLGSGDSVQPAQNTPITPNSQVYLIHSGTQIASVTQTIPAPTQTIHDSTLTFGTSAVRQAGSPGQQVVTYQVDLQNGKEVGRRQIQVVVTAQPVTQIIAVGNAVSIPADKQAVMAQAGIASSDYAYVDYIVSRESGWCPTKMQGQYGACPGYAPTSFPSYLGYGLGQATPATKMSSFGADWATNPVTQLRWATSYADGRFGSWEAAYEYWASHHNW